MSPFAAAILAVIQAFVLRNPDPVDPDPKGRQESLALGIEYASNQVTCYRIPDCSRVFTWGDRFDMAGMELTQAEYESHLRYRIQVGECGPHECDPKHSGGEIVHKARSLWQMHRLASVTDEQWNRYNSLEPEDVAYTALQAAKLMSGYYGICGDREEGMFRGLANGKCLPFAQASDRAALSRKIAAKLRKAVRG